MKEKTYCVMFAEDKHGNVRVENVTRSKHRDELMKLLSMKLAHNPDEYKYTIIEVPDVELEVDLPIKTDGTLYWSCFSNNGVVYRADQMSYQDIAGAIKQSKSVYPYITVNCKTETSDVINMCLIPGKTEEAAIKYCQKMIDKIMRERKE